VTYVEEPKRLGTAGALSLLKNKLESPFFVVNGDILTSVDFSKVMEHHSEKKALATMCIKEHEFQLPYAVIHHQQHLLERIEEKPKFNYRINTGMYILNPEMIDLVPADTFYDMPSLFETALKKNYTCSVYMLEDYWLDIGQMKDYELANHDFILTKES
jgi:NDP-sugar pyrophosphorylase family protein